jgi:hypothetical protein
VVEATAVSTWGTPPPNDGWTPAQTCCNSQQWWSDSITLSSLSLA